MHNKGYKEYDFRGFTVDRLQRLADDCKRRAAELNVQIYKKGSGSHCFGILKIDGKIFFCREYQNAYDFMNTAQMFVDFGFVLEGLSRDRASGNGIEDSDPYGWLRWWYEKKELSEPRHSLYVLK